jgi:23S rRNA (cytidine1920-2'-O)/16S rRNA (cytidine1409-2'-O)-methyltransferase
LKKQRLDLVLVERGFYESRERARRAVMAGLVSLGGQRAEKPGTPTGSDAVISIAEPERYVGRGGHKLEAALKAFSIDPGGLVCLDVGASTGGFTDCLLQHGARRVHAIDVGHGQIHWKMRDDPRVVVREGLNARHLTFEDLGERVGFAVADVSFISLTLVLGPAFELMEAGATMVALIKPQFELAAADVGRGGVVRDNDLRLCAADKIRAWIEGRGARWLGCIDCPVAGRDGNVEFLAHLAP